MASIRNSTFFANLPPPAECLAILVGCAETFAFGLAGLANPFEASKPYGLPIDAPAEGKEPTEDQKVQAALVQAVAARNLRFGVLILTFACYLKDRRALGIAIGSCAITGLADALIVNSYGIKHATPGHLFGVVNTLAIGASLLYWGRDDKYW